MRPSFSLGIEEEYQTIDPVTRDLRSHIQTEMLEQGKLRLQERVKAEMHTSVIEVGTRICHNIDEARAGIYELRREMIKLARENGLVLVAGATHPFADWRTQEIYPDPRYHQVVKDLQLVARANLIFGLHVHVGIEDREAAIRIMNSLRYFLPHIMALATNSPFWLGLNTGYKGYRAKVFENFPRTGIPDAFQSSPSSRTTSTCSCAPTASTTPRRSGGTSGHTPTSAPWRCEPATSPCAPRRRWPSPRSSRPRPSISLTCTRPTRTFASTPARC